MIWTTESSPVHELELERAWDELNQALDRRVRVSLQMRLTACVADVLTFMPVVRKLEADEIAQSEARQMARIEWDRRASFRFAAAVKAMYYFVRALQDAAYAVLLEASGQRAGVHSSMNDAAKNAKSLIRQSIDHALPEYIAWFEDFRGVRNQMKFGASTAFGSRGHVGAVQVRVTLQKVDDARRHVGLGRELTVTDIDDCLAHSAKLLAFVTAGVTAKNEPRREH